MHEIPFKGIVRKVGNSFMVTIPKEWVGQEIKENETYNFTIHLNSNKNANQQSDDTGQQ